MQAYAMKLARVPSWERALEAPNWLVTMTPIEPARLVTNAIMKKRANMIAIARTLVFCFAIVITV